MHLVLHSPVGGPHLTFPWPLVHQSSDDVIATMKWVLEDLSELKYALEYNVLQEYETDNYDSMRGLCARFNKIIDFVVQMEKGTSLPAKRINKIASEGLLTHILDQTYSVSIKNPRTLNKYQVFSPEVYGEVSHELMSNILERVPLTPEDIFLDLGSGVGHLVLQLSALGICKLSFGIEKERIRQDYAEKMSENFQKWMTFYGKTHREYQLIHGDFLAKENLDIIRRSTVIFVNNLSFGPVVDHKLSVIFRGLKDGTRIITSKSLCPINMRITERNFQDFGAIAHVFELKGLEGPVSWTNNRIPFFLHVIDTGKLENYRRNGVTMCLTFDALWSAGARCARPASEASVAGNWSWGCGVEAKPKNTTKNTTKNIIKTENIIKNPRKTKNPGNAKNSSNKENIPNKFEEIQMRKNTILAQIQDEEKQHKFLLKKINKLTTNGFKNTSKNTIKNNDNSRSFMELNKELIKVQINELMVKNTKLHEQAKFLQRQILDLENEYLDISQMRFEHFVNCAEAKLKLL